MENLYIDIGAWGVKACDFYYLLSFEKFQVLVPAFSLYGIRINDSLPRRHICRVRTES